MVKAGHARTGLAKEADRHKPLTATDRLRVLLDTLENQLGALGRSGADEAIQIPALLEEATTLLVTLTDKGGVFLAEESRLRTILAQLERNAAKFMATVGPERLAAARPAGVPDDHWWWFVGRLTASQRKTQRMRWLRIGAIAAAVLVALVVVYRLFLAPDPAIVERSARLNNASALAEQGDFAGALEEVHLAQTAVPNDPYPILVEGTYLEVLGNTQQAEEIFGRAKLLYEEENTFILERAQAYMSIGQLDVALEDITTVLDRDPRSAVAYYLKGILEQNREQIAEAYDSFALASTLADEAGNTQLSAMARVQMAYISQRVAIPSQPGGPTATPTP
jgi:tetratricopeptide (TPR) repeat protein